VPASELTLQLLGGLSGGAAGSLSGGEQAAELEALHAEVYRTLPYAGDLDPGRLAGRFGVQCRQPGFVLAVARSGGYLIGCATGLPLRPSTSWWRGLTAPLADDVTAEPPGRTFALLELMVLASWRRQGIGRSLHDLILSARPEERATLVVPQGAAAAQAAFQRWGWRKVARTRSPSPQARACDLLVLDLGEDAGPADDLPALPAPDQRGDH
jgi:ribosomal protein S18 acetylase RimI-like enzyme